MNVPQFEDTIAELHAQTAKLADETSKIIHKNPYVPLVACLVITLALVTVPLLFF